MAAEPITRTVRESPPAHEVHLVHLDQPIAAGLADELARRIYFVDERILGFELIVRDTEVRAIRLRTGPDEDVDILATKLRRAVAQEVDAQLPAKNIRRWTSVRGADDNVRPAFNDLVSAGFALPAGEGQVAVAGPVLALMDRLDALIARIAMTNFGATEYRYPTLVPTEALAGSGYLTSFPHHVMFTSRLPADLDGYRAYIEDVEHGADPGRSALARCVDGSYCLPPTMCYHTFQQLRATTLATPTLAVTARGKSFRYESRYATGMERLWDFTIRETVLFGSGQHVQAELDRFLETITALFDSLGFAGHCELATDAFFAGPESAASASSQRLLQLKFEVRLTVAPGRTIAVGSFNLHGTHFGTTFEIGLPRGDITHSACTGFGLERLAYAVLCQFGLSENDWPEALRPRTDQWEGTL